MFSKQKVWKPKTKLPEATVKQVTVKSSKPRTPAAPVPSYASTKRKRDSSPASSSANASSRPQRKHLRVPSPPRKRARSPGTINTMTATSRTPAAGVNDMSSDSEEEPHDLDLFKQYNQPKLRTTMRADPARDLPSNALKALARAGYVNATGRVLRFVHACDVVSLPRAGDNEDERNNSRRSAKQADKVFPDATDDESIVDLQYPGSLTRERFHLVDQRDKLSVIKDILKVVKNVRSFYITGDEDTKQFDGRDGIIQRLRRAAGLLFVNGAQTKNIADFKKAIDDYNKIVLRRLTSGTTLEVLKQHHVLPDDLVVHIMTQLYDRVITPSVDKLKSYTNGTDYIYGEMKPGFITQVLCTHTDMSSTQTFVDLGSGVGNVVLQAALQIGCKSLGCEYMDIPATLAKAQHEEFRARCKLWGIQPGEVELYHGDFRHLSNLPRLYKALNQADVVVTNNKGFTPELNSKLSLIFLELKSGCNIVSLTDFSAASRHNTNDIAYALTEAKEYKWRENWVSWTDEQGPYFITSRT